MQKYFWIFLFSGLALGLVLPAPALALKPYLSEMLMILMFFSCLKMNLAEIKNAGLFKDQFLVLYFLAFFLQFAVILLFKNFLDRELFIGLILCAAAPAGISTAFIAQIVGGNQVKALSTTVLTLLLSPIIIPLVVWIFARQIVEVNFLATVLLIVKLIAIPFALAQIARWLKLNAYFDKYTFAINTFLIILLTWSIVAPTQSLIFENAGVVLFPSLIILLLIIIIFGVSYIPFFRADDRTTIILLGTFKNYTLTATIALSMFGPMAGVGSVVFMILGNIAILPIQMLASRRP